MECDWQYEDEGPLMEVSCLECLRNIAGTASVHLWRYAAHIAWHSRSRAGCVESSRATVSGAHGPGPMEPSRERFHAGAARFTGTDLRAHPSLGLHPPKTAKVLAEVSESECARGAESGVFLLVPERCLLKRLSADLAICSPVGWYTAPSVQHTPKVLLSRSLIAR